MQEIAIPRLQPLTGGTLLHFHEIDLSSTTQIFNGIAIRSSLYGKSGLLDAYAYTGVGHETLSTHRPGHGVAGRRAGLGG